MDEKNTHKKIKLLVTIVDRGRGEKLTEMFRENNVMYNIIMLGKGTAQSEILDYLGLGQTEKDIVLSVVQEDKMPIILEDLKERMQLKEPGHGIAFTIPISSVDSLISLDYISSIIDWKKE